MLSKVKLVVNDIPGEVIIKYVLSPKYLINNSIVSGIKLCMTIKGIKFNVEVYTIPVINAEVNSLILSLSVRDPWSTPNNDPSINCCTTCIMGVIGVKLLTTFLILLISFSNSSGGMF